MFPLSYQTDGHDPYPDPSPHEVEARARRVAKVMQPSPAVEPDDAGWSARLVRLGGVKVSLERLKDFGEAESAADALDEEAEQGAFNPLTN